VLQVFFHFGLYWFLCKWKLSKINLQFFFFADFVLQEYSSGILLIHSGFRLFLWLQWLYKSVKPSAESWRSRTYQNEKSRALRESQTEHVTIWRLYRVCWR
jgi:hypothetical protein